MILKISTLFYCKFGADLGLSVPVGIGGLKLEPVRYTLCPIGAFGQMSVPIGAHRYRKSGKIERTAVL